MANKSISYFISIGVITELFVLLLCVIILQSYGSHEGMGIVLFLHLPSSAVAVLLGNQSPMIFGDLTTVILFVFIIICQCIVLTLVSKKIILSIDLKKNKSNAG